MGLQLMITSIIETDMYFLILINRFAIKKEMSEKSEK